MAETKVRSLYPEEVSQEFRVPVETLKYWRQNNRGPRSYKQGRRVLYALDDLEAWFEVARQSGTAT